MSGKVMLQSGEDGEAGMQREGAAAINRKRTTGRAG